MERMAELQAAGSSDDEEGRGGRGRSRVKSRSLAGKEPSGRVVFSSDEEEDVSLTADQLVERALRRKNRPASRAVANKSRSVTTRDNSTVTRSLADIYKAKSAKLVRESHGLGVYRLVRRGGGDLSDSDEGKGEGEGEDDEHVPVQMRSVASRSALAAAPPNSPARAPASPPRDSGRSGWLRGVIKSMGPSIDGSAEAKVCLEPGDDNPTANAAFLGLSSIQMGTFNVRAQQQFAQAEAQRRLLLEKSARSDERQPSPSPSSSPRREDHHSTSVISISSRYGGSGGPLPASPSGAFAKRMESRRAKKPEGHGPPTPVVVASSAAAPHQPPPEENSGAVVSRSISSLAISSGVYQIKRDGSHNSEFSPGRQSPAPGSSGRRSPVSPNPITREKEVHIFSHPVTSSPISKVRSIRLDDPPSPVVLVTPGPGDDADDDGDEVSFRPVTSSRPRSRSLRSQNRASAASWQSEMTSSPASTPNAKATVTEQDLSGLSPRSRRTALLLSM